jgi:hypothetical protein
MAPKINHTKYDWIHVHVTKMAPKSDQMKLKLKRIHEHVSIAEIAEMVPNTNWIHVHVTRIKIAPTFDQMNLKWIHSLNTTTKLPPKPYKTVIC